MLPKNAISIGYADTREYVKAFYPLATLIATAIFSMNGSQDSIQSIGRLPLLSDALKNTYNEVSAGYVDDDGITYYNVGSSGMP